ncbi:MAG TPA: hypothetical protein VFE80_00990, partial [Beijerinckiaceae bacterium]|nr:hypothetical protein [Beijerinckiaceae bacterium]
MLERDEVGREIRLREACRRGAAPPDDAVRGPGDGVQELGRVLSGSLAVRSAVVTTTAPPFAMVIASSPP